MWFEKDPIIISLFYINNEEIKCFHMSAAMRKLPTVRGTMML